MKKLFYLISLFFIIIVLTNELSACPMNGVSIQIEINCGKAMKIFKEIDLPYIENPQIDEIGIKNPKLLYRSRINQEFGIVLSEERIYFGYKDFSTEEAIKTGQTIIKEEFLILKEENIITLNEEEIDALIEVIEGVGYVILEKNGEWKLNTVKCMGHDLDLKALPIVPKKIEESEKKTKSHCLF